MTSEFADFAWMNRWEGSSVIKSGVLGLNMDGCMIAKNARAQLFFVESMCHLYLRTSFFSFSWKSLSEREKNNDFWDF